MAEENPTDELSPTKSSLSRSNSLSRLNAQAPEFVPRTPPGRMEPRIVQIHPVPPPHSVIRIFQHPPNLHFHRVPPVQNQFEYFGGGGGFRDQEVSDPDHASSSASAAVDLSEDVVYKITNQVPYFALYV